jgi:protein-L-isoaspartate O-methyltransferase
VTNLRPNDRVLLLATPPPEELQDIVRRVSEGIVVGVLDGDAVYEARRALRDHANVMITPAEADGSLPWKEDFFTVVYAPAAAEPSPEMLRVLEPGGTAWVSGGPVTKR